MNGTTDKVQDEVASCGVVGAATAVKKADVVVGVQQAASARRLIERVKHLVPAASVLCVETIERLRQAVKDQRPEVIIADDRILAPMPLAETIAELAAAAPVVLVAVCERHAEIGRMVAAGQADFVPRAADWELLAASLIERRLRSVEECKNPLKWRAARADEDMGEIFRHEINNPLTGILGNAELLLAHSDKFPAVETQRIRTVVELAVRLRETVRLVSDRWRK